MSKLKRYALFQGSDYYPGGGWDDFVGTYDTREEAEEATKLKEIGND